MAYFVFKPSSPATIQALTIPSPPAAALDTDLHLAPGVWLAVRVLPCSQKSQNPGLVHWGPGLVLGGGGEEVEGRDIRAVFLASQLEGPEGVRAQGPGLG